MARTEDSATAEQEEAVQRAGVQVSAWTVAGELQLRGYDDPILVYEPADGTAVHATN